MKIEPVGVIRAGAASALVTALLAANVAAVPLTLIPESGDARCAIVVAPAVMASGSSTTGLVNPALEAEKQRVRLRDSVQDLAAVLKKMTGREVPVVTGPAPAGKTPIFIGSSAQAVFGPVGVSAPFQQGMRVVVDAGKGVGLYGESMLADSYAVYTFLDQLGCRWFMPGELGEIIPQKAELVVEEVDLQDAPHTVYRGGSGYGFDDAFMRRNRMGGVLPPTQHCLESGYISQQEKALHPEWIAEYADGTPMPNRLKWSNAELANRIGEIIAGRQRTSPQFFYCLSPDDGAVFDQSEEDKALDAGDFDPTFQMISITDRAVTFYNRIVERAVSEHPDLLFSALAYVQYTRPPLRERPHTNLVIQLAPITYSRAHPMNMDEVPDNTALRYIISGWGDASQAMSYYFYAYYLADPVSSAPFLRKWAVDIPYIYKHGSCRYWQPETMGNNEFFFMAQWMAQRMAWNPEQDPWALYREANDAMYGPAAETMWAFWNAVDKCWVETPEYSGAGWGHINRFTPERVAEISALIAQAANEAGTGPARERVRLAETSWKLTSAFTQLRRDLAEGRWTDLDTRSQAWKKTVSQAAIASGDHRCYAWCWFGADKTFGGQYYDWFYSRTHASAQNIATNATLLVAKPVRDFRWKAVERGAPDTEGFSNPGFNDSAWPTTDVALQTWSSLGLHNHMGSMWYRTTIDVAQPQSGKTVWLWVGSTDGSVKAFVNGQAVQGGVVPRTGETFKPVDAPSSYGAPMRFDVTSVIRPGANSIALFATRGAGPNEIGTGGLLSPVVVYGEYMNTAGGTTNVNFTALTQSVGEGGGKVTVTLQLSEVAAEDVTVPLVLSGTAAAGSDFLSFPTSATISAGATNATFDIALVDDTLFEAAETLVLTMGEPTHAVPGYASTHTISILDNDSVNKPAVRFTSESQSVAAGSTATLGVSLTKASGAATTIGLALSGTATNEVDYTVDKTSVTIPAGETEAVATFDVLDTAAGKTIIVSINDWPSNADVGTPRIHTMTVAASEAPPPALPTAAFASAAQTVQENAGTVSISVVLSQASSSAVSIPFTLGGTAQAGADYQSPASPLTIPAGQTSGTIDIVLAADGLAEPAETIIVVLGTPTGATLGATTTHTLTIAASEAAPQADYNVIPYRESFEGARWNDRPLPAALAPAPGWRVPSPCGAVVAATGRYAYTGRRPISGAHENILQLDPAGAAITNRLDPAHDLSASVLHVDAMVSFEAAGEASPLGGADGAPKIAVYANNRGRLCILHGCLDAQGGRSGVVETETNAAVPTNGWCRVSVAFDATVEPGGTLPEVEMFCVRIDGEIVRSPAAYSASWSTDWRAGNLPRPSPGGVWFPSADKSAQSRALGGLVLKGSGKIDDLCVVEEDPFLGMGERALLLLR